MSYRMDLNDFLQDRYQVIDEIGRGGMGSVFLALDHRFSKRVCVVKEMLDHLSTPSGQEEAVRRFNQEADMLASLNHPGIPYVFDRFNEGNRHYLVMEYISGMDLHKALSAYMEDYGAPFPENEVAKIIYQVTEILDYLHGRNPPVYHRDVKPHNMIITLEGRLKLVDFGIAKVFRNEQKGTGIGTEGYAAPEQYKGFADHRTDFYALGASMHHLLTGRDPQFETPFDFPPIHTLNPLITEGMEELIEWLLRPNPGDRPENAGLIRSHLLQRYPTLEQQILEQRRDKGSVGMLIEHYSSMARKTRTGQMLCPHCLTLNRKQARFCKECGAALGSDIRREGGGKH